MAYTKLDRVRPSPAGVWDSARTYTALELVNSPDGWKAYLARKAVPAGTALTDTTYWTEVLDVSDVIAAAQSATADANAAAAFAEPIRTKADGIKCTIDGAFVAATDASDDYLRGLRIFGKTTQDGTPSPDSPVELVNVGSGGSIGVQVRGKNLLDASKFSVGSSIDVNDNTIIVTPTATGMVCVPPCTLRDAISVNSGVTLTLSGKTTGMEYIYLLGAKEVWNFGTSKTLSDDMLDGQIYLYGGGNGIPATITDMMICHDSIADDIYEPYKSTQSLALTTPNGLPGIPVSSGGNYTDADGRQWICDEIDLERGVYVGRIARISSYAGESISGAWMSSTGALTSGATVLYQLATPIETALSATEIAAYRALHSNYPNTSLYNDAGAHMAVSYNADTKTYIDNKFAALSAAIV